MDWELIEGNWLQLKGNIKLQWAELSDDELESIAGRRDSLAGKIQEKYGMTRDEAEEQIAEWGKSFDEVRH